MDYKLYYRPTDFPSQGMAHSQLKHYCNPSKVASLEISHCRPLLEGHLLASTSEHLAMLLTS